MLILMCINFDMIGSIMLDWLSGVYSSIVVAKYNLLGHACANLNNVIAISSSTSLTLKLDTRDCFLLCQLYYPKADILVVVHAREDLEECPSRNCCFVSNNCARGGGPNGW